MNLLPSWALDLFSNFMAQTDIIISYDSYEILLSDHRSRAIILCMSDWLIY